jgi:HTH-type transcriptional regulator, transcriptional repressor of NAD biosynthesis genes
MRKTTGMLLGKFLPPHRGHQYLIDFAQHYTDHLYVQVCTIAAEPILGQLRYEWMRDFFAGNPGITVVHHTDENPQAPEDDPEHFWEIWPRTLLKHMPAPPDYVFASEEYGLRLAESLDAAFVPVDIHRTRFPTSGTYLRNDIVTHWKYLLPTARPYFIRRVAILGEASEEKATLIKRLITHFPDTFVAHYPASPQGQRASEDALSLQSESAVLFCDITDLPVDEKRYGITVSTEQLRINFAETIVTIKAGIILT